MADYGCGQFQKLAVKLLVGKRRFGVVFLTLHNTHYA